MLDKLMCSWCLGKIFQVIDEEIVECLNCYHKTDWFEAYKKYGDRGIAKRD